ncbi:MAG: type II secretion system protein [Patescibacteria group bacterium]|jgi:Tfp pilus assembly protein PilV
MLLRTSQSGFNLVEAILSVAVFGLMITALVGAWLYGQQSTAIAGQRSRAIFLAEEGLEATRNLRDANFSNLTAGSHGLVIAGNVWTFSGVSDLIDSYYRRQISIRPIDANRFQVTSTVAWQQTQQRWATITLATYLTNWQVQGTIASCSSYCQSLGIYIAGACRRNNSACNANGETRETGGAVYCTIDKNNTCCCQP